MATVLIGSALLAVVVLAARNLWKDHKKGGCTGGCAGCPSTSACQRKWRGDSAV